MRDNNNFKDVLEGNNLTLTCRAYLAKAPPEWFYLDKITGQMTFMNETYPPQGKQKSKLSTITCSIKLFLFKIL